MSQALAYDSGLSQRRNLRVPRESVGVGGAFLLLWDGASIPSAGYLCAVLYVYASGCGQLSLLFLIRSMGSSELADLLAPFVLLNPIRHNFSPFGRRLDLIRPTGEVLGRVFFCGSRCSRR
jgi:hypothetical protein